MISDEQIEARLDEKGLNEPRITIAHIESKIVREDYHVFEGTTVTVCALHMENGYVVTGESAAVSPGNFDAELGRQIAKQQAMDKIWALEGYVLRERIYQGNLTE